MLWTYGLKEFSKQLNVTKVEYDGINTCRSFQAQKQILLFKITTHGAVQFMSYIKYYKVIYLD